MAPATDTPKPDAAEEPDLRLRLSRGLSLSGRVLAVNILALALLAGGFFYLDSYRARLLDRRAMEVVAQTRLASEALSAAPEPGRGRLLVRLGVVTGLRLRAYGPDDAAPTDSWRLGPPTYVLRDPVGQPWRRQAARTLDRLVGWIAGADPLPAFREPRSDRAGAWPEVAAARDGSTAVQVRQAADLTPVISAAAPMGGGAVLLSTINARDVTRTVREERLRLGIVLLAVLLVSVLLSIFLARTIALPLRKLAYAAQRVRLGRAREVRVPRLPSRRDEIGLLARALSDMTASLRQRIDNTEAFAADVTHELKNPLASLRSAVDALERVDDPALRPRLLAVVRDDVARLDRLISDVAESARVDAELSRARFEPIDMGELLLRIVREWEPRAADRGVRIAFARPRAGTAVTSGVPHRLGRAVANLLDNAISFSPADGLVELGVTRAGDGVVIRVEDEGPGVPAEARAAIFERFHTDRPDGEDWGRHSGLGLSIARTIVEGHGGTLTVKERPGGLHGARFTIRLPAAQ